MTGLSRLIRVIKRIGLGVATFLIIAALFFAFFGPILKQASRSTPAENAKTLGLALLKYAADHGNYPEGKSSTEIFQKLLNEGYLKDPRLLYDGILLYGTGKTAAGSTTLVPTNVCWDITIPFNKNSNGSLPIVFTAGYRMEYVPGGKAIPLVSSPDRTTPSKISAMEVFYLDQSTRFSMPDPDHVHGDIPNVVDSAFQASGQKYQQLTPDGPLGP